jgi:cellulose synthase/poly-beta-1,6-N-acetylglucosamine synthase-like glycosyltransferase
MYLECILFASLLLLLHTYLFFPLTLPIFSGFFSLRLRRNQQKQMTEHTPTVSLLISAYNEEAVIEQKILNCLNLDYPEDKLQILIGNDGSKDNTAQIIKKYAPRITLIDAEKNQGKAAMLNQLVKHASGDILVFCDANTLFFPNVVRKISQPFHQKSLGCVCGHLILHDKSGSALGEGEATYWDLESEIKKFEGQLGVVIGGNGALYAIRKFLFTPLPTRRSVMDDFFITVKVLEKGYESTFISSAIGTEQTSKAGIGEYNRKIRIGRANFNYLFSYLPLLNPLHPLVAYFFLSHKLLRWFSPHFAIALFVSSILLLGEGPLYQSIFALEIGIVLMALVGLRTGKQGRKSTLSSAPYYFITMNYALLRGFFQSFLPEKGGGWVRIERGGES